MKKAFKCLSIVAISLSVIGGSPLTSLALENDKQTANEGQSQLSTEKASTDIVTSQDLGNQAWLINEVNRQLSPKKIGVDLTFEDLTKIIKISLNNRGLTGEVPPEIKNLVSLQTLLLYTNNLTGTIPAELGELKNLTELRLDSNQLTGTIPDGLGNIASIELQNNKLVGQIPLSLYENRTGLNEINVSGNQVTVNSRENIPSIYSTYTFIYPNTSPEYSGHIKAMNSSLFNLTKDDSITPFLKGSSTFIDLQATFMFDTEIFDGHHVTLTDINTNTVLYDGELTKNVRISLEELTEGAHNIQVVLDKAFNNPQTQSTFVLDVVSKAEDLTVKYVDETGKTIHEPQTVSGYVGELFDVTTSVYQLSIENYELDTSKLPTNGTGILSLKPQTVTYVYNKLDGAPLTIKYLDSEGKELAESDTLTGKIDEPYKTEAKDIAGYTVDESKLPANARGKYAADAQTVTYVYNKIPASIKAHDSTIYVGDQWNAEDNFDSALDNFGKPVSFSDVNVEGTVDVSKVGVYPVTYTFDGESVTVNITVKSKAIPEPPITPEPPVTPTKPITPVSPNKPTTDVQKAPTKKADTLKITPAKHKQSTVASKLKLPTTGDNLFDSVMYSVFGLIVVCVGFSLFFSRKKQH
ncbi:MucBP domain-containing protein [Listeria welshimeri]|uniref:MucBP domain-containing protein n=1 Tax=Listeria welshimeri TaxID=1643 RepID=UPI001888987F|nr:MucBP domain-containing protein [Listeria welshimeri]MBF2505473.1 MucBP domain-containing protein [Listeria welshimeri]MBF2559692.1 MucBP domain-containing protein [Listeria welshimeri]MBF2657894.1 MucBP domain-containing protein [Listeria welshimeri]